MKLLDQSAKTNWKFIAIVVAFGLIVGSAVWWFVQNKQEEEMQKRGVAQEDMLLNWIGVYKYSEFVAPNQTWIYELKIDRQEDKTRALLDIDGFQTSARIEASVREQDGNLDVVFLKYRPENIGGAFKEGDRLFSLQKFSDREYNIIWDALRSNVVSPGDARFEKTLPFDTSDPGPSEVEGWQTYRSDEFGFELKYPEGDIKEFTGWSESQNEFDAVAQLNFQECYIAFLGIPIGIEDENVKIETRKDWITVNGSQSERTYWIFENESGFAFINLDYPRDSYPYFLIYHSAQQECVSRINQILATFRFVDSSSSSGNKNEISWEEAVEFIRNCQVTMVSQTHSRDVYLSLRDGTGRSTIEPRIDMVSQEAGNASDKCGFGILIATE